MCQIKDMNRVLLKPLMIIWNVCRKTKKGLLTISGQDPLHTTFSLEQSPFDYIRCVMSESFDTLVFWVSFAIIIINDVKTVIEDLLETIFVWRYYSCMVIQLQIVCTKSFCCFISLVNYMPAVVVTADHLLLYRKGTMQNPQLWCDAENSSVRVIKYNIGKLTFAVGWAIIS